MKMRHIVLLILLLTPLVSLSSQGYSKLWKHLEKAEEADLPRSAIAVADSIIAKAEIEKNLPELLRAYVFRSVRTAELTPDSIATAIRGIERNKFPLSSSCDSAVVNSALMGLYADYAVNHRFEIVRRTDVVGDEMSDDIREWSGNMFVDKVRRLALLSLVSAEKLLAVSAENYRPFTVLRDGSRYYNHSMYHLLMSRAISSLNAINTFTKTKLNPQIDSLYCVLENTYRSLPDCADGYVLTALEHINWRIDCGFGIFSEERDKEAIAMYDRLISESGGSNTCAEVYYAKARKLINGGKRAEALSLCDEAIKKYNGYSRINMLEELRGEILAPSLRVQVEKVYYPGINGKVRVSHKNSSGLTIYIYKGEKVVNKRYFKLNPPKNYVEVDTTLIIQMPANGEYTLRAVADGAKAESRTICVSHLKLLSLTLPDGRKELVAVDAMTGEPQPKVTLKLLSKKKEVLDKFVTDADGSAVVTWKNEYRMVKATSKRDVALPEMSIYKGNVYSVVDDENAIDEVSLLTDRSIYRPGQTVYVKGIVYSHSSDRAEVVSGSSYTVVLRDANNREVSRRDLVTNEFGSFNTEFVLPKLCLNGTFRVSTERNYVEFRVEEYKRPSFSVVFRPVSDSYTVGDTVKFIGDVRTFSGVALGGQTLVYNVYRDTFHWFRGGHTRGTIVSSGETVIGDDGGFILNVALQPERNDDKLLYTYTVEAAVTSAAGETQTAMYSINAGNSSLLLKMDLPDRLCKDDSTAVMLRALNNNGLPVDVMCGYEICRVDDGVKVIGADVEANHPLPAGLWKDIPSGLYRLTLNAHDIHGRSVSTSKKFILFSSSDERPPVYATEWYCADNLEFDADHPAAFTYGTSQKNVSVFIRVLTKDRLEERRLLLLSDTIVRFEIPYEERYGDGVNMLFTFVKDGIMFRRTVAITRRLLDRKLKLVWNTFRDNLRPGETERWSLTVKRPDGTPAEAELLASMYDASLDKLFTNRQALTVGCHIYVPCSSWQTNIYGKDWLYLNFKRNALSYPSLTYDMFYSRQNMVEQKYPFSVRKLNSRALVATAETAQLVAGALSQENNLAELATDDAENIVADEALDNSVEVRSDFYETVFFYPELRTDSLGCVTFDFTVPESLTQWRFNGYAHTKDMNIGMLTGLAHTSKNFMVQPFMPRFLRVNDRTFITTSIINMSDKAQEGTVSLTLFNPYNESVVKTMRHKFSAEVGKTVAVDFELIVPDGYELLGCRIVADGGEFSDGEQHLLPVLSSKIHLTETLALCMTEAGMRDFSTASLFNGRSSTSTNKELTVELTSNPVWYAVMAMPSISLPVNENAITWASAYYANSISSWIVKTYPSIKSTVNGWNVTEGGRGMLLGNLRKNNDVKDIVISETPWVMDAESEQERRERITTLFDENMASSNRRAALAKLRNLQQPDGSWSWYNGMGGSWFVTAYIVELNARLARLTSEPLSDDIKRMQNRAVDYLHAEMRKAYNRMNDNERGMYRLSYHDSWYLYLVAISGETVKSEYSKSYKFYLSKVGGVNECGDDMEQKAMRAVVLYKAGKRDEAMSFVASMREYLSSAHDGGASFAFNERKGLFGRGEITAHVAALEAFDEVAADTEVVNRMKLWLLQQKRTQEWNSTIATANAIYALLMRGCSLIDDKVEAVLAVGGHKLSSADGVDGSGYIKKTMSDKQSVGAGKVTLFKSGANGVVWGAVYAQCDDNLSAVKAQGSGVTIDRKMYVERVIDGTPQLCPVYNGYKLKIGDKVVVRTTLNVDTRMDFVALKESRAACMEPLENISGYRHYGYIGCYVDLKDASINRYFDTIGKGVYVFESSYRISRRGYYRSGISTVQCAYSPEYASHSASFKVVVE
jgi:tetratricopeptide (TPR) repeat protein